MKIQPGDRVIVLDENIEGIVKKIEDEYLTVETSDGFEFRFKADQLLRTDPDDVMSSRDMFIGFEGKVPSEKPKSKPVKRSKRKEVPPMEVDLHVGKLLASTKGMTNHDILSFQIDTAKNKLEFAIRNRIPKIVFIHGVGEGVLKVELDFLLGRYENVSFYDADYQKYGIGATEVRIGQNARRA